MTEERIQDLMTYKVPENLQELERFLGLMAYIHKFLPHASQISAKLHALRKFKKEAEFKKAWSEEHQTAFEEAKLALAKVSKLSHLKPNAALELWTDASADGVGATLVQEETSGWRPIAFWSKSFNSAQKKYSAFDRELLAVSYAIRHFQSFVEGQNVTVKTDHRPLVQAFKKIPSNSTPLQIRHFSFISQFVEDIFYRDGKSNQIADALSRLPNKPTLEDDDFTQNPLFGTESAVNINAILAIPSADIFAEHQRQDNGLQSWVTDHKKNDSKFRPFEMTVDGQRLLVLQKDDKVQVLVPTTLQKSIFDAVHSICHPGVKATIKLLKDDFYWPYMNRDISKWVKACTNCKKNKASRQTRSDLQPLPPPTRRFGAIHVDCVGPFPPNEDMHSLFTIIDRWTSWPEAIPVADTTASTLANVLIKRWIPNFGVPQSITSDRGAQFTSDLWKGMCDKLGIERRQTSAYHPCSNGKVERFNGKLKQALRCRLDGRANWTDELPWELLGIRNFPHQDSTLGEFPYSDSNVVIISINEKVLML